MTGVTAKGETVRLNGDLWTVVDVAPAEPLAEMVATILEEEGFVVLVRGAAPFADVLSSLGGVSGETTLVLVPEAQAEAALALIAETVTDYEGEELEALLAELEGDVKGGLGDDLGEDEV
ncbi:hypothetical protein [Truepera radiovictrix]|uniref:DUF2007 domain-containing protein n=1 Tax=Truepera radiovictrix (strain DSM 17093 / CIP 108686 / LMG 22925 / RQ-24) TaxID=649638 RepID=D7CT44_TRURR|nr:hypothetical protein [Truepera radiovictrix]ADI15507.1 hypothetical protein Trad_2398 [Truepera radiovictrix DSM 17093]WMT55942.1 hypothetical protein RCV51_07925 [Truepera radiovictrix]